MGKWIKRGGVTVVVVGALAASAVVVGLQLADRKMQRRIDVAVQPVAPATAASAVERGQYLYASRGCAECHGANGAGSTFFDDGKGRKIAGPHIAPGAGSRTAAYRDEDWVRSIRHGIGPEGRALRVMPSEDYNRLTDTDLAALVGYVKQMPAVQGQPAVIDLPLPMRVLYGFGAIQDAAAKIDHRLPPEAPVPEGVTVEHGRYVANLCIGCHGTKFEGGKVPGGPPDWPAAARLAPGPGNVMAERYAQVEVFAAMFKSGKRPDGSSIQAMPFGALSKSSDTDVRAVHLYLRSLGR